MARLPPCSRTIASSAAGRTRPRGHKASPWGATEPSRNLRTSQYEVDVQGSAASYAYDPNGNLTQKVEDGHTWAYSWNSLGELTEVWKDGVKVATMIYDPVGRRVEKIAIDPNPSLTVSTEWAYDGMDILREKVTTLSVVSYS